MVNSNCVLTWPTQPRVLIVEDNERFATTLSDALQLVRLQSIHASNAEIARDCIRSHSPGSFPTMMLDNHLGIGMTGIELMGRLRDEGLFDRFQISNVIWTSTDTQVPGLWKFPDLMHNIEYGSNGSSPELLAQLAARVTIGKSSSVLSGTVAVSGS